MLGAEGDKRARENERGNGIERRKKRPPGKAVLDFFLQRVDYFESAPFVDNSFLDTLIGNRLEECSFMKFGKFVHGIYSSSFECFKDKG